MNKKIAIDPAEQLPPTTESRLPEPPHHPAPPPGEQAAAPPPDRPSLAPRDVRPEEFFPAERRAQLKGTWVDIQSAFIDEPRRAVQNADAW